MQGETLVALFQEVMQDDLNRPCLYTKQQGIYKAITAKEVQEKVHQFADGLHTLGIQKGDRVAILSENRPEWVYADLATLLLGVINVPIHTSNPSPQIQYILENSEATLVFSSLQLLPKILEIRATLPFLQHLICFDSLTNTPAFEGILEISAFSTNTKFNPSLYPLPEKEDVCTLIYTSGTTGPPKGVMLTHHNFVSNIKIASSVIPITNQDRALSFLPLSHVFERMGGYYVMFFNKVRIYYAESIESIAQNMLEVRPTFMCAVPRLYEKIYAKIQEKINAGTRFRKKIFSWACQVAKRPQKSGFFFRFQHQLADKLVFRKIREKTGGKLRYFISGGAPLSPTIAEFFNDAGIVILEGYGLTETSPILSSNTPEYRRIGTVGQPIPNVDIRIAPDGEILAKGPNIMKGYYKNEQATREVIDTEGWFHTGDIGEIDSDGFLRITDRKKDILITSGGKNVAPQNLENLFKTDLFIQEMVVIGDQRRYCVGLVVPDYEKLENWAIHQGLIDTSRHALAHHPKVKAFLMERVQLFSKELAPFEQIKKIGILEYDFSIETGELTPTLKIKRKFINEKYKAQIDALYAE